MRILLACLLLCALVVSDSEVSGFPALTYSGPSEGACRIPSSAGGGWHSGVCVGEDGAAQGAGILWIPSTAGPDHLGENRPGVAVGILRTKRVRTFREGRKKP